MKLSEALMKRADCNRRLQELRERIIRNAKYQEGEQPAEDPKDILPEYELVLEEFTSIVEKINLTNNTTYLTNGMSMVEALATRDSLKLKHSLYSNLAQSATPQQDRYSKSEIKLISSVSVKDTQRKADDIAKEYRELDTLIQQTNWNTDLI